MITIFRETGAGATTIGENGPHSFQSLRRALNRGGSLIKILSGRCSSLSIYRSIWKISSRRKIPQSLKTRLEELLCLPTPALVRRMSRTIHRLASAGGVVLIGRGHTSSAPNHSHALHIRLVAALDSRIQHIADYFGLSEKKVADYVQKQDRDRKQYVRRYLGADVNDPHHYLLVINSGKLGYEEASRIISKPLHAFQSRQALPSG